MGLEMMDMFNMDDDPNETIDYTKIVIEDMYTILTTQKNPWPSRYTKLKKLEFLDKMLTYLKSQQMYEMCSGIQKMKENIINESAIKTNKNRRK